MELVHCKKKKRMRVFIWVINFEKGGDFWGITSSQMEAAVQQCILYLECCQRCTQIHSEEPHSSGEWKKLFRRWMNVTVLRGKHFCFLLFKLSKWEKKFDSKAILSSFTSLCHVLVVFQARQLAASIAERSCSTPWSSIPCACWAKSSSTPMAGICFPSKRRRGKVNPSRCGFLNI